MTVDALCIAGGYILDLIFGDPRWLPHPVRGIGRAIQKLETPLRRACGRYEKIGGGLLAIIIIGGTLLVTYAIVAVARRMHPGLGVGASVFFLYTALATKDLKVESMRVYVELKGKNWAAARRQLAMIVGRDTQNLDSEEMIRATVETIAEGITDGIVSPLFYAFLGGAPLAMAFKAVSTLDSMVGYKNDRYKDFGWASARLDDIANYLPARLTALLLPVAAWRCGRSAGDAWRTIQRDGRKNPSPNSGLSEAGMAGALGVRLGGTNFYGGRAVRKPYIGDPKRALALQDVICAIRVMYVCSLLAVLLVVLLSLLR